MTYEAQAEAKREVGVPIALTRLAEARDRVAKAAETLCARLERIMRPDETVPRDDSPLASVPTARRAPLADDIELEAETLQRVAVRLGNALERLEL